MIEVTATVRGDTPAINTIAEACVKLFFDMTDDVDEWTRTDELLNDTMMALCDVGTNYYGPETFGWALVDAGLEQDYAESMVDRTLGPRPQKPDVYAENADLWQEGAA